MHIDDAVVASGFDQSREERSVAVHVKTSLIDLRLSKCKINNFGGRFLCLKTMKKFLKQITFVYSRAFVCI